MRFDVLTLFPEMFEPLVASGINRRAFAGIDGAPAQVQLHCHNPRDFSQGNYRRVDDRPFGGGPGMVMMAEPLALACAHVQAERAALGLAAAPVVLFSPAGKALAHADVQHWASSDGAVLVCGRYEGIDQRFIDQFVTHQISLGDFVLSGGEIAALALLDAVARLQPGVLGDAQSFAQDSFNPAIGGLLDCPHYTRPELWRGHGVPQELLSGNHAAIEAWRKAQRQTITQSQRPDLL
jgi:tRNA (guanine37-N1)-methyltransferase